MTACGGEVKRFQVFRVIWINTARLWWRLSLLDCFRSEIFRQLLNRDRAHSFVMLDDCPPVAYRPDLGVSKFVCASAEKRNRVTFRKERDRCEPKRQSPSEEGRFHGLRANTPRAHSATPKAAGSSLPLLERFRKQCTDLRVEGQFSRRADTYPPDKYRDWETKWNEKVSGLVRVIDEVEEQFRLSLGEADGLMASTAGINS